MANFKEEKANATEHWKQELIFSEEENAGTLAVAKQKLQIPLDYLMQQEQQLSEGGHE